MQRDTKTENAVPGGITPKVEAFIPVATTDLSGNEERYVIEAVRSGWISSIGSFLSRFEEEFATACGSQFALGVSNGTTALHLVLAGMNVQPGDEVIVPSMTYIATANAVRYCEIGRAHV